jgi:hypothetical protein
MHTSSKTIEEAIIDIMLFERPISAHCNCLTVEDKVYATPFLVNPICTNQQVLRHDGVLNLLTDPFVLSSHTTPA